MSLANNIIIVGFSGTGKTLVGQRVARLLGWASVDTDTEIEARAGKSVQRIFGEDGEPAFRLLEKQVLNQACSDLGKVVSTGGGTMVDRENRHLMLSRGLVICLDALPENIHSRLMGGDGETAVPRPLLSGSEPLNKIKALKAQRQASYSMAHHTIQTDNLTVEEVAGEVVKAWNALKGPTSATSHVIARGDTSQIPRGAAGDRSGKGGEGMEDLDVAAIVTHSNGSYPIMVGTGLLHEVGDRLQDLGLTGTVYIISDDRVFPLYGRQVQRSLQRKHIEAHCFIIPFGEQSKSLDLAEGMYRWLAERRAERGHAVLAVGGGVVGDLAGFVAATFLRGMPFIQVPTSMAAMVDASIGGKVAVNLPEGKNLVGAFYQPRLVLADFSALSTLGRRELAEGWAEAIKHGLILDPGLFDIFEEHAEDLMSLKSGISTDVIRRSVEIKARIVSEDERETLGRRMLLNYGHTVGHALEAATGYGQYLHGEAVSVGMMAAARISQRMGLISEQAVERQRRLLERFNLPTTAPDVDPGRLFKAMSLDKKTEDGSIKWVLLEGIGRAVLRRDVPAELVEETVRGLIGRGANDRLS